MLDQPDNGNGVAGPQDCSRSSVTSVPCGVAKGAYGCIVGGDTEAGKLALTRLANARSGVISAACEGPDAPGFSSARRSAMAIDVASSRSLAVSISETS